MRLQAGTSSFRSYALVALLLIVPLHYSNRPIQVLSREAISRFAHVSFNGVAELSTHQSFRKRFLEEKLESDSNRTAAGHGIRVELLHRDHPDSPLRETSNLTLADRIRRDVTRSRARADGLSSMIVGIGGAGTGGTFESPLSATVAEYVMSLSLGTPPQKFVVVVDTGSDLVWVQCLPCSRCFPQGEAAFNPGQSSSYRDLTCSDAICNGLSTNLYSCSPNCQYSYSYGDHSNTAGDFSTETVTLTTTSGATQAIPTFAFGCGHTNQGTFRSTDGLVGLGQGSISFSSQLAALFGGKFSYCLVSREQALSQTSPLLFGDAAIPMVASGLQFTAILPSSPGVSSFYYVSLQALTIGGTLLNIPSSVFARDSSGNGGTIFDSGTTFTQLTSPAYDALLGALRVSISYPQVAGSPQLGLDLCFNIAGVQPVVVPQVSFQFAAATFNLPITNVFVLVDNAGTMCLAMSRSPSTLNVFGNTQQQNFQILYDRQNARIGFTPLTCSSL